MAGANSNIQVTELDFLNIKNNLKTYLKSQDVLKDYNYEGAALNILLDVLAYNTQYNAYYLNMVANEMFLDSALVRNSVISQAKVLNYIPKSVRAPEATINLIVRQVTDPTLTLPKFTNFMSEAIDGVNYNFVTTTSSTVTVTNNQATFSNVSIKQGTKTTMNYVVDSLANPNYTFKIPNVDVDTHTLEVSVQVSSTNTAFQVYTQSTNYLTLDGNSLVYFLQEGMDGKYEIYFGDDILGKKLVDGNIVRMSYLTTSGTSAYLANSFVLMDSVGGYSNTITQSVTAATQGSDKESIKSIKFQAPKSYSAQSRAVTKEDYITAIQQNDLGYSFDAVNVWGGQENDPPVYGQVFISLKPKGSYSLTPTQKQRLVSDVINPISVLTVQPTIVDPDYTYVQFNVNVYYDPKKTNKTTKQIEDLVRTSINNYARTSLNTFNSTLKLSDFSVQIDNSEQSIITNEISVQLQKKFYPKLNTTSSYNLYFGAELKKGMFQSGVNSSPSISVYNTSGQVVTGVYLEEVPSSTGGVDSISVINPGFGYQKAPTVTISGDGTGATAEATINAKGVITNITVTNSGNNYTSAVATITNVTNDTTGTLGAGVVMLKGRYGTLRSYYNNTQNVKTILNNNIGTVDYNMGVVALNSIRPINVDDPLGQLTISATPKTTIVSSTYNRIITVDEYDPNAIIVNVIAKTT
jgi:hypothetical protein